MKPFPVLLVALLCLVPSACGPDRVDREDTEIRDGLLYRVGSEVPFTGVVIVVDSANLETEAQFRDGVRNGLTVGVFANGQRAFEEPYVNGVLHGVRHQWDMNGVLVLQREMKEGRPSGPSREWYSSGARKLESTYAAGSLTGVTTAWYESGQKQFERSYREGRRHGMATEWYESGAIRSETTWRTGKPDGPYAAWHEDGQKSAEGRYLEGELIELTRWDTDGKMLP
ncbi:MAG: toxin-antitoxin system YwqK family antitoxin [Gemmatimonadota bacterium]|nr:toxin-antitoxin system YwqK family antitoxin [Gemmatimonadota bacterium]